MCLLDEGCLPRGVLPHQHHQRLPVKVGVLELGRVELVEVVLLLQRQEVLGVNLLQPGGDILAIELSTKFREILGEGSFSLLKVPTSSTFTLKNQ